MPGKFYPPPNFPQSDLGRRADSRWALPQISSCFLIRLRLTALRVLFAVIQFHYVLICCVCCPGINDSRGDIDDDDNALMFVTGDQRNAEW